MFGRAFIEPPFENMPKVPACKECNSLKGDGGKVNMNVDENYVRDMLCFQDEAERHPVAKGLLWNEVYRSINRPESWRDLEAMLATMEPAQSVWGLSGGILFPVEKMSFRIALSRFERVFRKVVRGLYAFHFGERIPDDYGVIVVPRLDRDMYVRAGMWIRRNNPSPVYSVGHADAIQYQFGTRDPLGHNWRVRFYGAWAFYAHTGPRRHFDANNVKSEAIWG